MDNWYIRNALYDDDEGHRSIVDLRILDGRVAEFGSAGSVSILPDARVIDAAGLVLAPGWIDIQINGGFGEDFTQNPESIWRVAQRLPELGITSFLPTIITSPFETVRRAMDVLRTGRPHDFSGAEPLGLHLEGPFLNPQRKGAHNAALMRTPEVDLVQDWTLEEGVRLVTLAPELPHAEALIRHLIGKGARVSAGHSMATYEEAQAAFGWGVAAGTHLFNAMPAPLHRDPSLSGALLTTPGIFVGLIADGIHTHAATVRMAWRCKGKDELILVTDAMAALGMPDGRYRLAEQWVNVQDGAARLDDGTLAGSVLHPQDALRNLMRFADVGLADALAPLTATPARLLGLTDRGSIRVGAPADLVLISPQGELRLTCVRGVFVTPLNQKQGALT